MTETKSVGNVFIRATGVAEPAPMQVGLNFDTDFYHALSPA